MKKGKQSKAKPQPPQKPIESAPPPPPPQITTYDTINEAVHEYLLKSGLFKTVDTFRQELLYGKSTIDPYIMNDRPTDNFGQSFLLEAFDKGNKDQFLDCWKRLLPIHLQANDEICHKLEFYIRVYFTIYPMHPFNPKAGDTSKLKKELESFKAYLDSERATLSQIPELLPFYALPFVGSPHTHASFKHLFSPQWARELRNKLSVFASHFLPPLGPPLLYEIYKAYRGPVKGANSAEVPAENPKLVEEVTALKAKEEYARKTLIESQAKWTSFCRGILEICRALIHEHEDPRRSLDLVRDAAERVMKYEKILAANEEDLKDIEQKYIPVELPQPEIYPKFTSHNVDEMQELSQSLSMISQMQSPFFLPNLRFDRVKDFLSSSKDDLKICAVLQALRWRMTRARHGEPRKEVIRSYVDNDILGINRNSTELLRSLLLHNNKKVVEYIVCFLNVLASESTGAAYLVKNQDLIKLLLELLIREAGDTTLRQNALGALQKFSLHRTPQTIMIEGGCIEWIADTLKRESETLSDYTFEYITALLMNLALRTAGKKVCEIPELGIVKVLLDYVEHENLQVRTYINGTLYSLLTRPAVKEQAKAYGMEEMLQHMLLNSDEQIKRQLVYILNQLQADQVEECVSDDNEDALDFEDEENYETENEEEIDEDIVNSGIPTGEQLLQEFVEGEVIPSEYMSPAKSVHKSSLSISSVSRNLPSAMKSRPKIPRTPLNQEMLAMVKKENEGILKSATHIYKNENANKKKVVENPSPAKVAPPEEIKKEPEEKVLPPMEEKKEVPVEPPEKKEEIKDPMTKTQEFKFAFQSRTKIARTPPKKDRPGVGNKVAASTEHNVAKGRGKDAQFAASNKKKR